MAKQKTYSRTPITPAPTQQTDAHPPRNPRITGSLAMYAANQPPHPAARASA